MSTFVEIAGNVKSPDETYRNLVGVRAVLVDLLGGYRHVGNISVSWGECLLPITTRAAVSLVRGAAVANSAEGLGAKSDYYKLYYVFSQ